MQLKRLFVVCLISISISIGSATPASLPPSDELVRKVVERAKWAKARDFERQYAFVKSTQSEEMDHKGELIERKEKREQVVPALDGRSRIKVDARSGPLSDQEIRSLAASQSARTNASAKKPSKSKATRIELTEEIVSRFNFEVLRREYIGRRAAWVVAFEPKPGTLPVRQIKDRFVNRATGTIWVDEQDYEIVKAQIRLLEPVTVTGGLLGAIDAFRYFMERTRVDDGVWLLKQTDMFIRGRKFLTPIHKRKIEHWSDFMRIAEPSDEAPIRTLERSEHVASESTP